MADNEEYKFNPQSFLLDFFNETIRTNRKDNYGFLQIEGTSAALVNKMLLGSEEGGDLSLWNLTTAQAAMLVPKVAIYKIMPNPEGKGGAVQLPFNFNKPMTMADLMKEGARGRGMDVGLTSFTWNDMGTDPGTAGLSFEAELKLKFQSFEGIFMDRDSGIDGFPIKFADLIVPPAVTRGDTAAISGERREVNPSEFIIKAVIGWSTPSDPGRVVFPPAANGIDSLEVIRRTQTALILTLIGHDIDIKEDGSVDLTIKYQAAMEGRLMSPKADLLKYDSKKEQQRIQRLQRNLQDKATHRQTVKGMATGDMTEKVAASVKAQEKVAGATDKPLPESTDMTRRRAEEAENQGVLETAARAWGGVVKSVISLGGGDTTGVVDTQSNIDKEHEKAAKEDTHKISKHVDRSWEQAKKNLANAKFALRVEAYARFMKLLESKRKKRVFFFELSEVQLVYYESMYSYTGAEFKKQSQKDRAILKYRKKQLQNIRKSRKGVTVKAGLGNAAMKSEVSDLLNKVKNKEQYDKAKEAYLATRKEQRKSGGKTPYYLNFFYLGDLVSAALEIMRTKPVLKSIPDVVLGPDDYRYILGTIDLWHIEDRKIYSVPLSDIPISMELFQNWFLESVVEKNVTRLPFLTFIRSICSKLIVSSINPRRMLGTGVSQPPSRTSIVNFVAKSDKFKLHGRSDVEKPKTFDNQPWLDITKQAQCLFIYVGGRLNQAMTGDKTADEKNGIFHAYVGKNTGVIKKVSFTRTDLPFQREARILGAKENAKTNLLFSDHYNAEITMIGNALFKPGMLVFIDPTAMGIGRPTNDVKTLASNLASQIGIGGYYMVTKVSNIIESGKFETSLNLVATTPLHAIRKVTAVKKRRPPKDAKDIQEKPKPKKGPPPKDKPASEEATETPGGMTDALLATREANAAKNQTKRQSNFVSRE